MIPYSKMIRCGGLELHATKGWRGFARPRKTNRRRKLIPCGECIVPLSRAAHTRFRRWNRDRAAWKREHDVYVRRGNIHGDVT